MKCKKISLGFVCLFIIGLASCKKKLVEPNLPEDSVVVVTPLGNMADINGVYFGTYQGGNIPNLYLIDSVYAEVDSIGTSGYEIKIYNDRGLHDYVRSFSIHFEELLFMPCDIGTPTTYYKSWGTGSADPYNRLEVISCDSINASKQASGRGGCPIYGPVNGFVGKRVN
jgi:hypothetical protein